MPAATHWQPPPKAARLAVALTFFMNGTLFATWVSRIPALQATRGLSHGMRGLANAVHLRPSPKGLGGSGKANR